MTELRRRMEDAVARVHAQQRAYGEVLRRAERRRIIRRATGAILALGIAAGGIGIAYATFRPDARPAGPPVAGPTPGPTPTNDDATPEAVPVEITNASTDPRVPSYVASLLQVQGRGPRHGGYRMTSAAESEGSEVSVVLHAAGAEAEALRLRDRVFPGATIRQDAVAGSFLRVVVGADFVERHTAAIAAFALVERFGQARSAGQGAERYVASRAASFYRSSEEGSLYGYAEGCPVEVWLAGESLSGGHALYLAFCRRFADSWTELVRVERVDGELKIADAQLVAVATSRG